MAIIDEVYYKYTDLVITDVVIHHVIIDPCPGASPERKGLDREGRDWRRPSRLLPGISESESGERSA